MGFFDNLDQTITGWGQNAVRKGKDVADTVKIQSAITGLENQKKEVMIDLGKYRYNAYKMYGGNPDTEELHMIESIDDFEQQIQQYSKQLQRLKGVVLCPNCHAEVPVHSQFCSSCGCKMPVREEPNQGIGKSLFCQQCGAALEEGQRFCINCGMPIEDDNVAQPKNIAGSNTADITNDFHEEDTTYEDGRMSYDEPKEEVMDNQEQNGTEEALPAENAGVFTDNVNDDNKVCPNCGKEVDKDTLYCTSCGTKLI